MKYLLNPNKRNSRAHLWDGEDTYCRMYSTGGLVKAKYVVSENKEGREVCQMCRNVWHNTEPQNLELF